MRTHRLPMDYMEQDYQQYVDDGEKAFKKDLITIFSCLAVMILFTVVVFASGVVRV